uniref:Ovule protein n=1 Tax=Romanomermis culicivorax TaxID=13658 RepID=A0A915JZ84_ROMCU
MHFYWSSSFIVTLIDKQDKKILIQSELPVSCIWIAVLRLHSTAWSRQFTYLPCHRCSGSQNNTTIV